MKLVCLKFLTLTCDKELPNIISNLFHLQTLIIRRHNNIKNRRILSYMPVEVWGMQELQYLEVVGRDLPATNFDAMSYMPVEVWGMQELQHLEVVGRDLPTPNFDATLEKLSCLCSVSAKSCTREILKRIPNLKILEILMELKPYDDGDISPPSGLDNISKELQNLGKLVYSVPNPDMKYEFMIPLSMFLSSLFMLELSSLGCPWKHMSDIGSLLPNLRNLKLEHYAFRGPKWDIEYGCFRKLETLVIEVTDLVRWKARHGSLPMLRLLSIRHCYKLKQLDWMRDPSTTTKTTIELVECSPLVAGSARQLQKSLFNVLWYSSFL